MKKDFYEGVKNQSGKREFNEGEKLGVRKRGDPNYYLSLPYNTAFEIKDWQKNLVIGSSRDLCSFTCLKLEFICFIR